MKEQISISEKNFFEFKEKEGIFSIEGKEKIQTQKMGQLTGSYSSARARRLTLSAALNELTRILNTKEYDKVPYVILGNPLLEQLHRDLVGQEMELAGLKKTFNYQHSDIILLENKMEQTRETFEEELVRTKSRLQSEYQALQDEEGTLQSTLQQLESEALNFTRKEMEYTLLEREVEANKVLYDLLFKNFTDANVTKAMPATNIILLEKASYPLRPIKPNKVLNFILGTILSLMIGVGLSFFLEYIDRTINSSNDLEKWLELPVLTVIPKIATKKY
jgi:uncharacterized protein involved in exopolysaccharide biosynthesis